jgi:hypothetical protein
MLHAPTPIDIATVALWLGHEDLDTTDKYIHADMELKCRALDRTAPPNAKLGRYRPPDSLLAFLETSWVLSQVKRKWRRRWGLIGPVMPAAVA